MGHFIGRRAWLPVLALAVVCRVGLAQVPADSRMAIASPAGSPGPNYQTAGEPAPVVPGCPCCGWFVDLEAGAIDPRITELKTSRDGSYIFLRQVHSLDLDWSGVGEVGLGYRFAGGNGVRLSYRGFGSESHTTQTGDAAAFDPLFFVGFFAGMGPMGLPSPSISPAVRDLHARLDVNRLDLDYFSAEHILGDSFLVGWTVGARLAILHLDTQVSDRFIITEQVSPTLLPSTLVFSNSLPIDLHQGATDTTTVAGIHAGLNGSWSPAGNGWALFGKADGGILGGGSTQRYSISMSGPAALPEESGTTHGGSLMTTLNLQAGVQYTVPLERLWMRLSAGYQFEAYWFSAVGGGADKHALYKEIDLTDHGPFARCEIRF
jgi:hypothetical protein